MTHGSLFSGIGGFDLAAEWCGWENIFHCEWNPFGQKVLKHHFPNSISYEDITKTNFSIHRGTIDVLSGGFPCQPYSSAGKRLGKEDERHLWPEMLRAIREIQPSWVVGENVRGLTNWNGGLVFDEVQFELEAEGYEVLPFLLPDCAVNAPHRRDRIWFIAYSKYKGLQGLSDTRKIRDEETNLVRKGNQSTINITSINTQSNTTDTNDRGIQARKDKRILGEQSKQRKTRGYINDNLQKNWDCFPTVSPICGGDDGLPKELDGITFSKWRNESIKAYGNAIVPQIAYEIFKSICLYQEL